MPYVSVVIPAYHSENTIEKCLKGIRGSTYQDYELIVVDCGSRDKTIPISRDHADSVITLDGKNGRNQARLSGIRAAKGEILVNIDSDVVIRPGTLAEIVEFFSGHPAVHAVTGLLSKEHPHPDFFSQYKNLYMNYIFSKLPSRVSFLYGSVYAVRREVAPLYDGRPKIADDTAFGQRLISHGKSIAFLRDLEVVHLKKYNLSSWVKNDFQIAFNWAEIFLRYEGYRQLGKNKIGFAHSPKEQLVSVVLAPLVLLLFLLGTGWGYSLGLLNWFLLLTWVLLNGRFLSFLAKEKSVFFAAFSSFVTFVDHLVMATGILCGFFAFLFQRRTLPRMPFSDSGGGSAVPPGSCGGPVDG